MTTSERLPFNSTEWQRIANDSAKLMKEIEPSISRVYAFGSVAKGEARPDSDIDVAVVISGESGNSADIKKKLTSELTSKGIKVGNGAGELDILCFSVKYFENPDLLDDVQRKVVRSIKALNQQLA